jgi:O-antigen/teichoic acid export membrane protein
MSKPYKKVLYNTALLSIFQVAGDFSGLILYIVLSRHFGPEGMGIYAFGLSLSLIAYNLINFGFDDYGIRECSLLSRNQRNILIGRITSVQFLLLILALIIFIPFLLIAKISAESTAVAFSILVNMISLAFSKTFFIPFNSQQRMVFPASLVLSMKILNVAAAASAVLFLGAPIYIALLSYGLSGLLLLFISIISFRKFEDGNGINLSWHNSISMIKTVWPFSASLMIYSVYSRIGVIILTFLLGSAAAGIYAPAQKFVEVGLMPIVLFNYSIYPVLSKFYKQNIEKFEDSADKLFRAVFIVAALLLWVLYYIVPLIIVPLLGEKFRESVPVIRYFSILIFLNSFSITFHKLLLAANLQMQRTKAHFFALLINLAANFSLIPFFGAKGAVFALILSELTVVILFMNVLYKKTEIVFRGLVRAFGHFIVSFGAALITAVLVSYYAGSDLYSMSAAFLLFIFLLISTGFVKKFDIPFFNSAI